MINIPLSDYKELVAAEAKLEAVRAYLDSNDSAFPNASIILALIGKPKKEIKADMLEPVNFALDEFALPDGYGSDFLE